MYKEEFGERLKAARTNAGYTQQQVSDITKISRNNICRYEKGEREPDIETLGKLIDFYEINADWILGTGIKRNSR